MCVNWQLSGLHTKGRADASFLPRSTAEAPGREGNGFIPVENGTRVKTWG